MVIIRSGFVLSPFVEEGEELGWIFRLACPFEEIDPKHRLAYVERESIGYLLIPPISEGETV